jgi:hypothetical protein
MAQMTDGDLKSLISQEETQALGYHAGDLSREREKSLDYYHGLLSDVAAPPTGRSDVVSTDVRDAVDGMLPDLLDIFLSSDDVVKFEPQGPEDEQGSRQATDAANYVFYRQNNGALVLYEWFKSALLEKNGVVKYYHEKYSTPTIERYDALNEAEFQMLVGQPGVQIIAHSAQPDPMMQGMSLHDVQARIVDQTGKICIEGVPSEEFLICSDHRSLSLKDVRFIEHRRPLTVSSIRAMGIDVDPNETDDLSAGQMAPEYTARRRYTEELNYSREDSADPSQRQLTYCEIAMLADVDGDGLAERRRIIKIGKTIYENEYSDHVPFAAICPAIMPYRFYGLSIADLVSDIQRLKSVIWRQMLDSLYLSTNPRIGVMESMVNLDDLLVSRPGGVVRFKTQPSMAWAPLEQKFVGQQAFPMIEYMDSVKENRTGFTRYSQGLDANSLNKTATGVSLITASSAKRLKLIARMFAETGVKDLMQGIKHLLIKTRSGKPLALRLRGQWVNVDPREWNTQWDMTVNVGLGTNDKQAQAMHIQEIMAVQKGVKEVYPHLVTDVNAYNAAKRLQETAGYKQEGEFFTPPGPNNPAPPPQPNPEMAKLQAQAHIESERMASAERIKAAEVDNGQTVAKIQAETAIAVAEIKAATDKAIAEMKAVHDSEMQSQKSDHDSNMQKQKDESAAQMEIFKQGGSMPGKRGQGEQGAITKSVTTMQELVTELMQSNAEQTKAILQAIASEKEVVRDKQGNITGTRMKRATLQ